MGWHYTACANARASNFTQHANASGCCTLSLKYRLREPGVNRVLFFTIIRIIFFVYNTQLAHSRKASIFIRDTACFHCDLMTYKAKKKINAMSQSSWQIGRPDLNAVFFNVFFFWAANVWDLSRSQLWNMELDFGWTRYKAEHKSWRSLLFKVFHCVCHIFSCIFWQASHKKTEKKIKRAKKIQNLNFAESNAHRKNKCARQLWDIGFILFSLSHSSLNHNGNMPYPVWKCLPYGSAQAMWYHLHSDGFTPYAL